MACCTAQIMPEHVYYRQAVEKITNYRLGVVRKYEDVRCSLLWRAARVLARRIRSRWMTPLALRFAWWFPPVYPPVWRPQTRDIEAEVQAGQVEELIEQAKDELRLIPEYACAYAHQRRCLRRFRRDSNVLGLTASRVRLTAAWREWESAPMKPDVDQFGELIEADELVPLEEELKNQRK